MAAIYTVGHGLLPLGSLVISLSKHEIDAVVDVRSHPFSGRAPQFNKETLRSSLETAGIKYLWMGQALGGRPSEALLTSTGAPDYERMASQPTTAAALENVVDAATRYRLALLCSEARPEGCHRTRMLEPQLEQRGAQVEHILPDGTLASQPTLFL